MLGFVIGVASLIGLAKLVRRGRCGHYGRGYGNGGRCGEERGYGPRGGYGHEDGHYRDHDGPHGEERGHGFWGHRGGFGGGFGRGFGRGPARFFMRQLFWRLETTPGQERVMLQAFEEVRQVMRDKRSEIHASREDVAKIISGATFDEAAVGNMFSRHDDALRAIRLAVTGSLAKVHEALTPEQRQRMADMLHRMPDFGQHQGRDHGPYRA
jgi:Spy/CpxP family protein refolding chaperone